MTARPGRIKKRVVVDLPRPRSLEVTTSPVFNELRREALALIREESLRAASEGLPTAGKRVDRDDSAERRSIRGHGPCMAAQHRRRSPPARSCQRGRLEKGHGWTRHAWALRWTERSNSAPGSATSARATNSNTFSVKCGAPWKAWAWPLEGLAAAHNMVVLTAASAPRVRGKDGRAAHRHGVSQPPAAGIHRGEEVKHAAVERLRLLQVDGVAGLGEDEQPR
jgi:hypothetical protein